MGFSEGIASEIMFKSTIPINWVTVRIIREIYSKDPSQAVIGLFN